MISYDQLGRPEDSIIVFQLNGVQDLVYAVVKNHTGCSREPFYETIYFLKKSNSVVNIDPHLMDANVLFAGSPLDSEWGWHRPSECRGMFPNHMGWYYNTGSARTFEAIKKEILREFEKIKQVYDRNTNVQYR
jgi:hypothetical protein